MTGALLAISAPAPLPVTIPTPASLLVLLPVPRSVSALPVAVAVARPGSFVTRLPVWSSAENFGSTLIDFECFERQLADTDKQASEVIL